MPNRQNDEREGLTLIEVKGLSKRYGAKVALEDVSFRLGEGECCALIGLDGAGKTTLLDLLSGVMEADQGSVQASGCDVLSQSFEAKRHVGYMPAVPPLYRDMTPRLALRFVAEAWGQSARESSDRIDRLLKETGLLEVSDTPTRNLTDSARRMLSLAQALFMDPETLLIDEPTAGLDVKDALTVRRVLAQYQNQKTILLATKNLTEVEALCARALVLKDGRLVADEKADRLYALRLATGRLCARVAGSREDAEKALSSVQGVKLASAEADGGEWLLSIEAQGDRRAQVAAALVQGGLSLLELTRETESGEDLLNRLTAEKVVSAEKGDVPGDESGL